MTTDVRPTLRALSGAPAEPIALRDSALILIDCQQTYREGVMLLEGVEPALDECRGHPPARSSRGHSDLPYHA